MRAWQLDLKNSITNYLELFRLLDLNPQHPKASNAIEHNKFPLLVTKSFISRINKADINDPLLQQILPIKQELKITNNVFCADPLQEAVFNKTPGLLHKYHGRVLIIGTKACAINCRYCFRKEFPYNSNIASGQNLEKIINYITKDSSITEIILSGGDPLIAPNNYLQNLLSKLESIKHIETLRIHSRVPIVLPSRLEPELISILLKSKLNIVLVTHSNHPQEINEEVADYFKLLQNTKIVLLNQTVLLKNINDNAEILAELSKKLFSIKILPYYLHILDKVTGTKHFAIKLKTARKIYAELQGKLPGYLVPKLVTEQPGAKHKIMIL